VEKKVYTVAVDLGSSNVVVVVGSKNEDGSLHIEKVVSAPSEGVKAGEIDNIALVGKSIRMALNEVEQALGISVSEVYTGISGHFIRCESYTDHVFTIDSQSGVSQRDVDALFERMANVQAPDDEIIMERIPQNYMVDDNHEVKNPVGSFGKRLSSTFRFILCERTPLDRLKRAFNGLGVNLLGIYPSPLTTVDAVVLPEESEEGVAVVNLGGGKTDIAVVYRNVVRYIASIPMGGAAINADICTLSIPEKYVENLKQSFGSAVSANVDRNKLIRMPGRTQRETKEILACNLATAIEARAMDIVDMVKEEIRDSGFSRKLACGIVLAGGGERLTDIDELFRRETGMEVRRSEIDNTENPAAKTDGKENKGPKAPKYLPAYATALGILMRGIEDGRSSIVAHQIPRPEEVRPPQPAKQAEPEQPKAPKRPEREEKKPVEPVQHESPDAEKTPESTAPAQPGRRRIHGESDEEMIRRRGSERQTPAPDFENDEEDEDTVPEPGGKSRRGFNLGAITGKLIGFINRTLDEGGDEEI